MMKRKNDIKVLLSHSDEALRKIEAEYKQSLHAQSVSAGLKIEIKNLCRNLRSVLDYIAHDIRETEVGRQ